MSGQVYNSEEVRNYLLGFLSDTDTERFDELSITDDQFVEALKAAENDLVDAYAQGELTGPELERFKSYHLASDLRREKAGFAETLREWSDQSAPVSAERIEPEGRKKRRTIGWFSGVSIWSDPRPAWQWRTAFAVLALLAVGGWLLFEKVGPRQEITQTAADSGSPGATGQQPQEKPEVQRAVDERTEQELAQARAGNDGLAREKQRTAEEPGAGKQSQPSPAGLSIASFILTPQMRSIGQMTEVSIPPNRNHLVMHLQLEPNEFRAYKVYLLDGPSGKALWRSSILRARTTKNGKTLDVGFRSDLLKQGTYNLQVSGLATGRDSEVVGDYRFKVVKE